jgi:hypothetical protein
MEFLRKNMNKAIIAALIVFGWSATVAALYYFQQHRYMKRVADTHRLGEERSLGEQAQLEKRFHALGLDLSNEKATRVMIERTVSDLELRLKEGQEREAVMQGTAARNARLARELADLKRSNQQLADQLAALRDLEIDLRTEADKAAAQRDALEGQLASLQQGALMVNNAEVAALAGKRGRLTVKARRTNEVRMAFDLPIQLAPDAAFTVTTPKGRTYQGADPALTHSLEPVAGEPMASLSLIPEANETSLVSRVHLKFSPKEKLEPGTYKIDVSSGGSYLQTVRMTLR